MAGAEPLDVPARFCGTATSSVQVMTTTAADLGELALRYPALVVARTASERLPSAPRSRGALFIGRAPAGLTRTRFATPVTQMAPDHNAVGATPAITPLVKRPEGNLQPLTDFFRREQRVWRT